MEFQSQHQLFNKYSGWVFLRMDWLHLFAIRGTLKGLQDYSPTACILWPSAIFTVQLSHPYMSTGKTIPLTGQTFFGKVMSLLFNMLSWLVIAFLPKSKRLLILWLKSPSSVILEPKKVKSVCFHRFPIYLPWKIMASGPITSGEIHGETVSDYFSGLQNHCRW